MSGDPAHPVTPTTTLLYLESILENQLSELKNSIASNHYEMSDLYHYDTDYRVDYLQTQAR
jgi:hypothetical protein